MGTSSEGTIPDLSILGLDPVSLSKIETHLLASLGSKGKNRNSLACLRNAGFHSAETNCISKILAATTPRLGAGCMKYVLLDVVHKGPCRSLSWLQRTGEKRDAHILKI